MESLKDDNAGVDYEEEILSNVHQKTPRSNLVGALMKSVTVKLKMLNSTKDTIEAHSQKRDHGNVKSITSGNSFLVEPQTMKVPKKKRGSGFQRYNLDPHSWAASFNKLNRPNTPSGIVIVGDVTYVTVSSFWTKTVTQTVTIYATATNEPNQPMIIIESVEHDNGNFAVYSHTRNYAIATSFNEPDTNTYHKIGSYVSVWEEALDETDTD